MIHTVAPVWAGAAAATPKRKRLLSRCYQSVLEVADANAVRTIAFPCIGTGAYRWPNDMAAKLAFEAVTAHLRALRDPHDAS